MLPRPSGGDAFRRARAEFARALRILVHAAQGGDQLVERRLEPERVARQFEAAIRRAEVHAARTDPDRGVVAGEIVGRAAARDDRRGAAGHRLQHRQAETFAAVGRDQGGRRAIQARQRGIGIGRVDVHDRRGAALLGHRHDAVAQRRRSRSLRAEILDDQRDLVAPAERTAVGFDRKIGALALDRVADEEKDAPVPQLRALRRRPGRVDRRIDTERDDVHPVFRKAGLQVHCGDEPAIAPHVVGGLEALHPALGDAPELPRLHVHVGAARNARKHRRPAMSYGDVRRRLATSCGGGLAAARRRRSRSAARRSAPPVSRARTPDAARELRTARDSNARQRRFDEEVAGDLDGYRHYWPDAGAFANVSGGRLVKKR